MAARSAIRSSRPLFNGFCFAPPVSRTLRFNPPLRRTLASLATEQPRLRLGSEAPNFQAKTTQGDIDFHQWLDNKWAILFSHPADFTPVCTTELGAFAKLKDEFEKRGVKMIGLVGDVLSPSSVKQILTTLPYRAPTTSPRIPNGSTTSTTSPKQTSNSRSLQMQTAKSPGNTT